MDTIWPETGANIKGITIDLNNVQNNYADHYENGTPGTVNYNDCYDLFVLIVQKATSSYFNLAEFSVRGQPACMVPGTEFCQVCWTPPPPPPSFWEGALWAFNGDTGSNNNRLVDKVKISIYNDDNIPISSGTAITGTDAIHGDYVTLGSNDGTTPDNYYNITNPGFRLECNNFTGATLSFLWRNVNNPDQSGGHIIQAHHAQSGHAAHMGFWVGVVADTGFMAKVAGNWATLNYTFDSPKNNEWFYFTAVFAENGSTNANTTGGVTYYINNKYVGYKATGGGLSLNKQNWEIGKKLIAGHGDSHQQPSGDLASLVIKNKPLENIQDYKYLHDFNKGTMGNHLDGTYIAPATPTRPAATQHIIHYYDGSVNNTQLIDHVGSNNGIITGTETTGTSEYGPTVIFTNHLYEISHPSFSSEVTISFYWKPTTFSQAGSGTQIVGNYYPNGTGIYIGQKNNQLALWMLCPGHNATTYNTSLRDSGSLKTSEFALITYIYNNGSFDLYFGGKYWGICPIFTNINTTPDFTSGTWSIGGGSGRFAQGELTSLIICDQVLTIEEVMDIQDYATTVQPGSNIKA